MVGTVARNKHDMVQQLPEKDVITYMRYRISLLWILQATSWMRLGNEATTHVDSNWYQLFIVYHSGGSYAQAHLAFCHLQYP